MLQAQLDVLERGSDGKARKLVVTVTFKPGASGRCEIDGAQDVVDHALGR